MKRSTKTAVSVGFLLFFMTLGFILLFLVWTGPGWVALLVFIGYLFIVTFLLRTTGRVVKALREKGE